MGPLNDAMKQRMVATQGDVKFDVAWTTLGEYLETWSGAACRPTSRRSSARRPCACTSSGYADRAPTPERTGAHAGAGAPGDGGGRPRRGLVADLRAGVLREDRGADRAVPGRRGVRRHVHLAPAERGRRGCSRPSTSSSRSPARRASRPRSTTSRPPAAANWRSWTRPSRRSRRARAAGLRITADMYTYTAGATGLDAAMPPWARRADTRRSFSAAEGPGRSRHADPPGEMTTPTDDWENLYLAAGSPDGHPARRVPQRRPEAADRQDARRGRGDARAVRAGHRHGPRARGRSRRRRRATS